MPNLVEIRDLKIGARTDSGREVQIIKGVSIDVAAGEIVALIGEIWFGQDDDCAVAYGACAARVLFPGRLGDGRGPRYGGFA